MDPKDISIRPGSWRSRVCTGVILATCIGTQTVARAQQGMSSAEDPVLSKQLRRIDQDKLLKGDYPLRHVVEVGRHLFSTPFTKAEGYGEGGRPDGKGGAATGPREEMFQENLEKLRQDLEKLCQDGKSNLTVERLREVTNFPVPEVNPNTGKIVFPYVRLNGLDSQSCFECHNSIGSERLPDTRTFALTRKQSTVGGPAGFASNAFINDNLPYPIFMFVRNPPHVFGIGYAQDLAEEMTQVLLFLRSKALQEALDHPNTKVTQPLKAKTTSYGEFTVTYTGDPDNKPDLNDVVRQLNENHGKNPPGFTIDWGTIEGVSEDLVVRPFQWKGIASNERNFVRDALQFHFGMQGREKNPRFEESSEDHDSDRDGVSDELSLGDVSALTIYTMTIRPPFEAKPGRDEDVRAVDRGRKIFEGMEVFSREVSCARCHTPSLHLDDSTVVLRDPRKDRTKHGPEQIVGNGIGLSAQLRSSAQLPAVRRFMELNPSRILKEELKDQVSTESAVKAVRQARSRYERSFSEDRDRREEGYAFDLTTLQPANSDPEANREHAPPLSETQPRLPNQGKTVEVPLFSDLRRHKMGRLLRERDGFRQKTDVEGITVAEDEFLTRPLWGVADTGPWLHDGRAQSLEEAILLHQSEGSEANDVIDAFKALGQGDKEAIIKFLLTLRLPLDPRYGFDDYR